MSKTDLPIPVCAALGMLLTDGRRAFWVAPYESARSFLAMARDGAIPNLQNYTVEGWYYTGSLHYADPFEQAQKRTDFLHVLHGNNPEIIP